MSLFRDEHFGQECFLTIWLMYLSHSYPHSLQITVCEYPRRFKNKMAWLPPLRVTKKELSQYKPNTQEFLKQKRTLDDFKIGLTIPEKLLPRVIKGGVILEETNYTLRELTFLKWTPKRKPLPLCGRGLVFRIKNV